MRSILAIAFLTFSLADAAAQTSGDAVAYQRAITIDPGNSLAHYRLGELYFRDKNYQSAATEFRAALNGDLRPRWTAAWSHIQLGNILNLLGQTERAANEYRLAHFVDMQAVADNRDVIDSVPGIVRPKMLDQPAPEYTDEARLAGLEGSVILSVTVSAEGALSDVQVLSPLGLGLDERAIEAVQRCRFQPGSREGVPVAMETRVSLEFLLPSKVSRWHLLRAQFQVPEGGSRATFMQASYPAGAGISTLAIDEGRLLGAIGRQGTATISFDVDERGEPGHFQVDGASVDLWGNEAISLIREWHFRPGERNGQAVVVPCTVDLAWGQRRMTAQSIEWAKTSLRSARSFSRIGEDPILVLSASERAYTPEALQARIEGTVILRLVIAEDGIVQDVVVLQPLGYGLDEKAIQMVRANRFPASPSNAQPDEQPKTAKVTFSMSGPAWQAQH